MPYRQAWETGQQRAHEMLRQAEHARMSSAAAGQAGPISALRRYVASAARAFASGLGRLADSLDARSTSVLNTRADGA